jgi:hypothetical protein
VRTQRQRRHGTLLALTVYSASAIAAAAWFSLYQFRQPSIESVPTEPSVMPRDRDERYSGTVVLQREGGGCRELKFDNITGMLQESAVASCDHLTPGANSTEGRMSAIRDAFSRKEH